MKFTYEAYKNMLIKLSDKGYVFTDYKNWGGRKNGYITA